MKQELFDRWINALESGEYQQCVGRLKVKGHNGKFSYCCLGVLCEVAGLKNEPVDSDNNGIYKFSDESSKFPDESTSKLPERFALKIGMNTSGESTNFNLPLLVKMNDNGVSFKEIAAHIKKNKKEYIEDVNS